MYIKLILILALWKFASCAKILAIMVVASHSHHLWNSKYLRSLAERGHEITYLSVDPLKNSPKNIRNILIEGIYENLYGDVDLTEISDKGPYTNVGWLEEMQNIEAETHLQTKGIKQLNETIRKEKFDLVVQDIATSLYLLGVVDVLGRPPVVGITAFGVPTWSLEILGNPMTYSSMPHFYVPYSDKMNILQRADNYFLHLFSFAVGWFSMRRQNELSQKCFGKGVRPLNQILDDINIIMVNTNHGLDYAFPKVPGLIPVGGLHIEKPKPLPTDLQTYLDEAKNGAIFFSLGSNIKSSQLKKDKIDILLKAFKSLSPIQVLWKWESETLPGKPENVKIGKWLPQNDILAHPNVILFFTHSGMLSTQEAIYHGKPIVGMPFLLDQHINVDKCVEKGLGEKLMFASLTVEKTVETIRKVISDPRYTENARTASMIFRDDIENPMDRAVYWTEYAIRHKGASHLRHSARDLYWYQNWMLDVLLITFSVIILILYCTYKLCIALMSIICGRRNSKLKKN